MAYIAPSTSYEATVSGFPSGQVGTVGVRIVDGQGVTVLARTIAGIIEHPPSSGIYTKTLTSPSVPGQYQIVWDTGGSDVSWAVEDLSVQFPGGGEPYPGDSTARNSLLPLVARVRLMVDDPGGEGQQFTDAEVQDALDRRRDEARYIPLTEIPTILPGGTTTYLIFTAPVGAWEDGIEVVNSSYEPLTPTDADLMNGRFTFAAEPRLPVMLSGFTYDLHGSAGDLLMTLATKESSSYDINADGLSLSRSQKAAAYRERAYEHLAKARTRHMHLVRTDDR